MKLEGMKDIGFIYGKRDRIVKTSVILSATILYIVTSWIEFMEPETYLLGHHGVFSRTPVNRKMYYGPCWFRLVRVCD